MMSIKTFIKKKMGLINIDKKTTIGRYTHIGVFPIFVDSEIGSFCSIGSRVIIGQYNHYYHSVSTHPFCTRKKYGFVSEDSLPAFYEEQAKSRPIIGNDVWIGSDAIILRGVKIGDGAIIGANSVVTHDIPPYSIAVGSPARVIKKRFDDDVIKKLMAIKWWDWDDEKIREHIDLFRERPSVFLEKFYKD